MDNKNTRFSVDYVSVPRVKHGGSAAPVPASQPPQPAPPPEDSYHYKAVLRREQPGVVKTFLQKHKKASLISAALLMTGTALTAAGYTFWPASEAKMAPVCTLPTQLDNALWAGGDDAQRQVSIARTQALLPSITDPHQKAVAEAVLGYWNGQDVTSSLSGDVAGESVVRYAQYIHYMRVDNYDKATETLLAAIHDDKLNCADKWDTNNRRYMLVHRLKRDKNYDDAYTIAAAHNAVSNGEKVKFEWMAGYLKLLQKDPETAITHFTTARAGSTMPISIARNEYWLGRAHQMNEDGDRATAHYALAAKHTTTFYGQLASAKLGQPVRFDANPFVNAKLADYAPQFRSNAHFRAAEEALQAGNAAGATKGMEDFMGDLFRDKDVNDDAVQAELQRKTVFLARMANQHGDAFTALKVAKKASGLGVVIPELLFPKPTQYYGLLAQNAQKVNLAPSLAVALARRESEFNPRAESGRNARGLMQITPNTAYGEREVETGDVLKSREAEERKKRIEELTPQLFNPAVNTRLGAAYLSNMIDRYGGSTIMALGAYNAGPSRMDRWASELGDPRATDNIDELVAFMESIPYDETREYIMRIVEAQVAYQALDGQNANIETILKRGAILAGTEINSLPFKNYENPPLAVYASFDQCPTQAFRNEAGNIKAVPASLTKMMTLYVAALTMKDPAFNLNMDTTVKITPFMIRQSIGLASFDMRPGQEYKMRDLMSGAGAKSDAISTTAVALAVAKARGWEGTEAQQYARFVQEMRTQTKRLGMDAYFMNATGYYQHTTRRGNWATPQAFVPLMHAFATDAPNTYAVALGQQKINIPMTGSTNPSSRFLANPNNLPLRVRAKTGFLATSGFNEAISVGFEGSGVRATIVIFGADDANERQSVISDTYKRMASHVNSGTMCGPN